MVFLILNTSYLLRTNTSLILVNNNHVELADFSLEPYLVCLNKFSYTQNYLNLIKNTTYFKENGSYY